MPYELNLSYSEYAKRPGLSSSALKKGIQSMLHMDWYIKNGMEDTDSLRWGRVVHRATLEPSRTFVVYPGATRRGSEWEAFKAMYDEDDIIKKGEREKLDVIAARILADKNAAMFLRGARCEVSCFWTDPLLGDCKCRLDAASKEAGVTELKNSKSVAPRDFSQTSARMGYDIQLGWNSWGAHASGLYEKRPSTHIVAIESCQPFDFVVHSVTDGIIEAGLEKGREIAAKYRACQAANHFPGVADDVLVPFELPIWYTTGADGWTVGIDEEQENGGMP